MGAVCIPLENPGSLDMVVVAPVEIITVVLPEVVEGGTVVVQVPLTDMVAVGAVLGAEVHPISVVWKMV